MDDVDENIKNLLSVNPVFVFALENEAGEEFQDANVLFVGVGKVNAVYNLTKFLLTTTPSLIVNLGTAGSNSHKKGDIVCCTDFIQRDMDVTILGFDKLNAFQPARTRPQIWLKN